MTVYAKVGRRADRSYVHNHVCIGSRSRGVRINVVG
jgi:hypothetical protein